MLLAEGNPTKLGLLLLKCKGGGIALKVLWEAEKEGTKEDGAGCWGELNLFWIEGRQGTWGIGPGGSGMAGGGGRLGGRGTILGGAGIFGGNGIVGGNGFVGSTGNGGTGFVMFVVTLE